MKPRRWTTVAVVAAAAMAIACGSERAPLPAPTRCSDCERIGDAPTGKPTAKPASTTSKRPTYRDCAALRKDHPKGVTKDHPAYRLGLDRDRDGRACEPEGE